MSSGSIDQFTLRIGGMDWQHWKSAEVTRQVDAVSGSFSLGLADPWQEGAQALPLTAGQACELLIDGTGVLKGYIGQANPSFSATDHGITVSGRDASADLVDCSAIHNPGQWINQTALQLAQIFSGPFGVAVTASADVGAPFATFKLEQGETAFDALDRVLKQRELLAMPDGSGGIDLTKIGQKKASVAVEQGKNILTGSASYNMDDRFSDYIVQGQQQGNDQVYGLKSAAVTAGTTDAAVTRYRPMLLRAENQVDAASARRRAEWECTVRAARAVTVTVTVQGFHMGGEGKGGLWEPNMLVQATIPFLRIDQELLISKVTYSKSTAGSITTLELKDPKAFMQEPQKKESAGGGGASAKDYKIEPEGLQEASTSEARRVNRGDMELDFDV